MQAKLVSNLCFKNLNFACKDCKVFIGTCGMIIKCTMFWSIAKKKEKKINIIQKRQNAIINSLIRLVYEFVINGDHNNWLKRTKGKNTRCLHFTDGCNCYFSQLEFENINISKKLLTVKPPTNAVGPILNFSDSFFRHTLSNHFLECW